MKYLIDMPEGFNPSRACEGCALASHCDNTDMDCPYDNSKTVIEVSMPHNRVTRKIHRDRWSEIVGKNGTLYFVED